MKMVNKYSYFFVTIYKNYFHRVEQSSPSPAPASFNIPSKTQIYTQNKNYYNTSNNYNSNAYPVYDDDVEIYRDVGKIMKYFCWNKIYLKFTALKLKKLFFSQIIPTFIVINLNQQLQHLKHLLLNLKRNQRAIWHKHQLQNKNIINNKIHKFIHQLTTMKLSLHR